MRHSILAGLTILVVLTALPAHAQTLFVEDFEAGTGAWILTPAWKLENDFENCGSQLAPFPSGSRCLRMGSSSGSACHFHNAYPGLQIAHLTTPITIAGTGATAWLRYANRIATEGCPIDNGNPFGPSFDGSSREISIDGGASWIWLGYDCSGSRWHKGRANLTPYIGQQILIRFTFWAGDNQLNDGYGWLIDDVSVRMEPGTPVCDSSSACPCGNSNTSTAQNESSTTVNIGGCKTSSKKQGELYAMGDASMSQDTVVLHANNLPPDSTAIFIQGSALTAPAPLGDGTMCLGGQIVRLGLKPTGAGAVSHPVPGGFPLSATASVNTTFAYQVYFRNAAPDYCTPGTMNLTNAYTIEWRP